MSIIWRVNVNKQSSMFVQSDQGTQTWQDAWIGADFSTILTLDPTFHYSPPLKLPGNVDHSVIPSRV